ncbi:MAG: thioredoxin domain-containing protein, partial [Bdellovibrionales bacterium]|nr:thioredoxin domain-containing protein [Bdellovibrionales bacterium]
MSMNELGREKSPYLLQHAKNPVHWKSWSKASLQLALTSNKPILVSIGYATCHWCHVMEKECFEDQAVADLLNQSFVCIKVDREEMPDVDDVYMTSLHLFGQRGGWPLNVFLTPDQLPFYGGTYFPKPQFLQVLRHISNTWSNESDRAKEIGIQIQSVLAEHNDVRSKGVANVERWLELSYKRSVQEFDDDFGGFGGAPKFPPYQQLPALLRFFNCTGELKALEMCETTLLQMFAGGIYDHIGGGFSRYAVDESWTVPHFEKMLYTNALLGPIYLSFYKFGQDETFLRCAQETAEYMMRDLLLEGGGFASGEDADSEGEEGRFYVFSIEELGLILGDDFEKWSSVFDFDVNGNFEGKIIFRLKNQSWTDRISQSWTEVQNRVRNFRDQRMRPLRDHKILTGWNALAIKFLVELYRVDRKKRNLEVAQKTGQFLLDNLKINDVVMRRVCDGEVSHRGLLEDYSYLISAFIDLYLATGDEIWLKESIRIQQKQDELFWDDTSGGYFTT